MLVPFIMRGPNIFFIYVKNSYDHGSMHFNLLTNSGLLAILQSTYSPAKSFKKYVKIGASLFATFKLEQYWDTWRRNTIATSRSQDAAEELSFDCSSATIDDIALVKEKQKFVQSIFNKAP